MPLLLGWGSVGGGQLPGAGHLGDEAGRWVAVAEGAPPVHVHELGLLPAVAEGVGQDVDHGIGQLFAEGALPLVASRERDGHAVGVDLDLHHPRVTEDVLDPVELVAGRRSQDAAATGDHLGLLVVVSGQQLRRVEHARLLAPVLVDEDLLVLVGHWSTFSSLGQGLPLASLARVS